MTQQISFTQLQMPVKSCAFTGHRELYPGFSKRKLSMEIKRLIENGVEIFYNGMAMGFDLIAAETVLRYQKQYPHVRLIACIPCYNQEKNFPETDKRRYAAILKKADSTVMLSQNYYRGCMQVRDQYMVDNADMVLCYCIKDTGGAAYTVKYCQKKYPFKPILEI